MHLKVTGPVWYVIHPSLVINGDGPIIGWVPYPIWTFVSVSRGTGARVPTVFRPRRREQPGDSPCKGAYDDEGGRQERNFVRTHTATHVDSGGPSGGTVSSSPCQWVQPEGTAVT